MIRAAPVGQEGYRLCEQIYNIHTCEDSGSARRTVGIPIVYAFVRYSHVCVWVAATSSGSRPSHTLFRFTGSLGPSVSPLLAATLSSPTPSHTSTKTNFHTPGATWTSSSPPLAAICHPPHPVTLPRTWSQRDQLQSPPGRHLSPPTPGHTSTHLEPKGPAPVLPWPPAVPECRQQGHCPTEQVPEPCGGCPPERGAWKTEGRQIMSRGGGM